MPSDMPNPAERTSPTPSQDNTFEACKLQHRPSQPSQSPGRQSSIESSRRRETLIRPQGLRASSRDTAEMHRSSTPPGASSLGTTKYTKTGRISKAAKGQRVHHCEECGKTYTRAEHLRRHQQNHKPGAYPCDWPSCGRSFYREDLLVRHKARQTPKRMPIPPNELPLGVPLTTDGPIEFGTFTDTWDASPPLSPPEYNIYDYESTDESSDAFFYQPQMTRARNYSGSSFVGYIQPYSNSRSPVSVGPSTLLQRWSLHPSCDTHYLTGPDSLVGGLGYSTPGSVTDMADRGSRSVAVEARDLMELGELAMLDIVSGSLRADKQFTPPPVHQHYLEGFWAQVHELFPIIHKPTFDHELASPLLRASILALGGQASRDRTDLANARTIHEKCLKVLKQRSISGSHTYRVCDMQAIVLVEIYSLFKSRRPPLRLSAHFETVYGLLSTDRVAFLPSMSAARLGIDSFNDELLLNTACKQRLLLACYVLEQQHSALFGREPTACFSHSGLALPYPTAQVEWDAVVDTPPSGQYERTLQALQDLQFLPDSVGAHMDPFRSMLLMACRLDVPKDLTAWADCCEDFPITPAAGYTPLTRLAYHTFMLCNNTPIRDLLAVAGESWVLAEKLRTQAEYTAAQIETRQWAARPFGHGLHQPPVQDALHHAFSILAVHQDTAKTGLLFQEWAIFLAALVIWARVYAVKTEKDQPRLSIPNASVPHTPVPGLDASVTKVVLSQSVLGVEWKDVCNILMWTKSNIEQYDLPHNCGLNSGAVDVLSKIIAKGSEDGWF
ncbi:hypothetical protein DOTSEDRAFT_22343 [Dothistroma septosporum NZE10]|uniref:C2H2-type domain-containing protein n=1 Tax=Dothistroma septosporum (strain NZE10 / CBS 128990) TaxID=675120 RepID=N1PS06_DOTSN|nr:hypothetical protein DOTSEDRAFT_22343 [Dothistroma septosporum NZE10]